MKQKEQKNKQFLIFLYNHDRLGKSIYDNPLIITKINGIDELDVIKKINRSDLEKIYNYYIEMLGDCDNIPAELSYYFENTTLKQLQKMDNDEIIDKIKATCEIDPKKFIKSMESSWTSLYSYGFVLFDTHNTLYRALRHTDLINILVN